MNIRSEKQFRAEMADKYSPETIDLLVKAEREAKRLKDDGEDGEESDEDEGKSWDEVGEMVAKARQQASDEIAKAEALKVEVYTVGTPRTTGSASPEQRPLAERYAIPDEIDEISEDGLMRDIAKAFDEASEHRFQALAKDIFKALEQGLTKVVQRVEKRIASQDTLIKAVLGQNEEIAKSARKQGQRSREIMKALDLTPAPRTPKYTLDQVIPMARPGEATQAKGSVVSADDLSDWLVNELDTVSKATRGGSERNRIGELQVAMNDLDGGNRTPDQIAKAIGFKQ